MGQQHNQPGYTDQSLIRNFCIIAHIDHGKSTVADRILQLSGIVPEREMRDRFLDRMDIEQAHLKVHDRKEGNAHFSMR